MRVCVLDKEQEKESVQAKYCSTFLICDQSKTYIQVPLAVILSVRA
jgi:hypothetical protein